MSADVAILSTGWYVPETELDNAALARAIPGHDEQFTRYRTDSGILTRFRARADQTTSDLVVEAARVALSRAGLSAEDLDLIVVGTDSPDRITPCTSVIAQAKLGARRAGTFDVGCGCASFPTAISAVAGILTANPRMRYALVAGAYMMHRLCAPDDPMQFFYGDGAGAVVVGHSPHAPGLLASAFRADGHYANHWGIEAGGAEAPASVERVMRGETCVRVKERYPREVNEQGWPAVARELCAGSGLGVGDIDRWIFTQVRWTTIERVAATLEIPISRAHRIMDRVGYTGSACIPMALHDAVVSGQVGPGDTVAMIGSGVGFNQAGVIVRMTAALRTGAR